MTVAEVLAASVAAGFVAVGAALLRVGSPPGGRTVGWALIGVGVALAAALIVSGGAG